MDKLRQHIYYRADIYCNQKYGNNLPYSFHLDCVEKQGKKFFHLLKEIDRNVVTAALINHESIEDFRMTYNDVIYVCKLFYNGSLILNPMGASCFAKKVADIVYCVTDEKGKTRSERKNDKYYKELSENDLAVFVKLSDIAANTLFSKLTGSSMYDKYKSEFGHFKKMCYKEKYDEFFKYVENL